MSFFLVHAPVGEFDNFFDGDGFFDAGVARLRVEDAVTLRDAEGQVVVVVGVGVTVD